MVKVVVSVLFSCKDSFLVVGSRWTILGQQWFSKSLYSSKQVLSTNCIVGPIKLCCFSICRLHSVLTEYVLNQGDFRASVAMEHYPELQQCTRRIDFLYLDTTYVMVVFNHLFVYCYLQHSVLQHILMGCFV